ncbi:Hypothetical protein D9617_2g053630 [Elsinoe fawcettii]|nr:Hypothetical protein D9617_2g053630 [Elsinoe fawcettii]
MTSKAISHTTEVAYAPASSFLSLPLELRRHIYSLVGIGSQARLRGLELVVLDTWRVPNTLRLNSEIAYEVLKCYPDLCFAVHIRWSPGQVPVLQDYLSDEVVEWLQGMANAGRGIWRLQVVAPPLLQFRWTCGPDGIGVKQLDLADMQMPDEIYYQAKMAECSSSYDERRLSETHQVLRKLLMSVQGDCKTGFQLKHIEIIAEAAYNFEQQLRSAMKDRGVQDDRSPSFGLFAMSGLTAWDGPYHNPDEHV